MVRRSFLQKDERRSRARLNWPLFSVSSNRSSEGSDRAATSPTGRRAIVGGPSETPKLSKHTGPAEHSSLTEDRTRARVVVNCRPEARGLKPPPRPRRGRASILQHVVLIQTLRLNTLQPIPTVMNIMIDENILYQSQQEITMLKIKGNYVTSLSLRLQREYAMFSFYEVL